MLRDVRHTVTDGLLGISSERGQGVHVKIGVSPIVSDQAVSITGNMSVDKIRERLGHSPLADRVMDSIENGANRIYCYPVAASIVGTVGVVNNDVTGNATCIVTGSPYNAFAVVIEITGKGGLNTAVFRYSIDGGYSFSDELTVPLSGQYGLDGTGLQLIFQAGEGENFEVGDTFTCITTAPQMTNADALKAIDKMQSFNEEYEFVHIVGE